MPGRAPGLECGVVAQVPLPHLGIFSERLCQRFAHPLDLTFTWLLVDPARYLGREGGGECGGFKDQFSLGVLQEDLLHSRADHVEHKAGGGEDAPAHAFALAEQAEQDVLGADVVVAES
jgi:hypothetical protein